MKSCGARFYCTMARSGDTRQMSDIPFISNIVRNAAGNTDALKQPRFFNMKRLWKEYRQRCAESGKLSFGYSKFCDDYNAYAASQNLTNRITHRPGYAIEVDWSGTKMHLFYRCINKKLCKIYGVL